MSFDAHPTVYWLLGILLMMLNVFVVILSKNKYSSSLAIGLGFALLVWMRLPIVVFNQEINPDESQVIGHALTLAHDPTYWRSVDGTTIGPLDIYPLVVLGKMGLGFDYTAARIFGLLCVLGSLWFFRKALQNFFGENVAQIGWLPPLFLLAFSQEIDLVHYSSEQVPLLLLNVGLWLISTSIPNPFSLPRRKGAIQGLTIPKSRLFCLGLVLGLVPFAKLQGVPQAAILGLWGLVLAYQRGDFFKNTLVLISGAVVVTLLTILLVFVGDLWPEFVDFYIKGNLIYAGGTPFSAIFEQTIFLFSQSQDVLLYLTSVGILLVIGLLFNHTKALSALTFWAALYLLASIYAATKSGNAFLHYLNFCIYPLALLGIVFWSEAKNKTFRYSKLAIPYSVFICFLITLPFLGKTAYQIIKHQPLNRYVSTSDHRLPQSGVTQLIKKYAQAGEKLVVWGWMGKYHVETQMPQGAAESHFERCIYPHPMRERYYERFLEDMRRNRPKVFVDAVGPNSLWLNDPATQSHEQFAELKQLIQTNYTFVGEVEHTRVYVRNAQVQR